MFHAIFYQPIFNLLIFLYNIVPGHDLGLAIILLTVIIKFLLWPLSQQSIRSQKALQTLQPKIEDIKKKYGNNREQMGRAMMALYKENKVNPLSSCLPLLIQLPFLIAVFQVFRNGLAPDQLGMVYSFISKPDAINMVSLGIVDLSKTSAFLAVAAGLAQYWQSKMLIAKKPAVKNEGAKDENMMTIMNKQMLYFMPALTVFIGMTFPGGMALYWLTTTLLTVAQQYYLFRKKEQDQSDKGGGKVIEGEIVK